MPDNNEAKWYIIHTFGGYEKKVKTSIENYAKAATMIRLIRISGTRSVIPTVLRVS